MRLSQSDQSSSASLDSFSEPGPSTNGASKSGTNKHSTNGASSNGTAPPRKAGAVAKVSLPGSSLFDDTHIDREEFVRLVIQSLREVGYNESAATLEAESGYSLETHDVSAFRSYVLQGLWDKAEIALITLGVGDKDNLLEARFLISQQKYLEYLEAQKLSSALSVLRGELAVYNVDPDQLHSLSSLVMCSTPEEVRRQAGWDGAAGASRVRLLTHLQRYIPPSVMIPSRRFVTIIEQSRHWQQERCQYHNSPADSLGFSLYEDHQCDSSAFPEVTTTILEVHTDEVWNLEWSHSGEYLASASKDKSAVIWRIGSEREPSLRKYTQELVLHDHPYPVGCIAWSLDDSILLTSSDQHIKLWNTKTGLCIRSLDSHTDTVTSIRWLPDDSGFISGGLDSRIIIWDAEGNQLESWTSVIRITDLAVTPDQTRVVAVGMLAIPPQVPPPASGSSPANGARPDAPPAPSTENRMLIYDLATKQTETSLRLDGELTSVRVSWDSQYALINHAPDEIYLWDIVRKRELRTFTGQKQGKHVIRSCFGGVDGGFVASGSEDGNVYVWHRDTGTLLEVLSGHGSGSVNSVAWNPKNHQMFASCSDDYTIRIWEAISPGMRVAAAAADDERDDESMNGEENLKKSKGKERISL